MSVADVGNDVWSYLYSRRHRLVGGTVLLILSYFILLPVLATVYFSFFAQSSLFAGSFTLGSWVEAFNRIPPVLFNTVVYTLGAALLTTILALCIAWVIARTNAPFRRVYYYLLFLVFFVPPVAWELSYVRLFGQNGVYSTLLGVSPDMYSLPGMILTQGVRMVPFALVLLIPLIGNIGRSMEEAARVSGAGVAKTVKDITFPLVAPGALTVLILTISITLGSFRVPLVIGLPGDKRVLATAIFEAINATPVNYGVGMVYSVLLVSIAVPLFYLYRRAVGQSEKYQTISGSGYQTTPVDIGKWRYVASGAVGLFVLLTIIGPTLLMVYNSLIPFYISPLSGNIPPMSFAGYAALLENNVVHSALVNSVFYSVLGATLLLLLSVLLSWLIAKSSVAYRTTINYLSFLPIGIPSVSLALGILLIYTQFVPIALYGTFVLSVIAYVTRYIPATIRIVHPAVTQIQDELLEAGKITGANSTKRLRTLVTPLISPTLRPAWAMVFAVLFFEMPISMMLQSSGTKTVAVALFELQVDANYTQMAALGVFTMVLLMAMTVLLHVVGRRTE